MNKEDSRVGKRDVSTTPSTKVSIDKFARASASANVQLSDSAPPTAVIPLIMSTKLSLSSASPSRWCTAFSSPETGLENSPTHSSPSSRAAQSRNNINIWRQTRRWCSLIYRQFPLRWTWHTLSEKGAHSTLRTSHLDLVKDVANRFLHGGFTYLFIKFQIILFTVWLICLPAMTSAWIFKDTLRNDTQVFLKFRNSILEIRLHPIKLQLHFLLPTFIDAEQRRGNIKQIPLQKSGLALSAILITPPFSFFEISYSLDKVI